MPRRKTLSDRIEERIARKEGDAVFLPREFADLGGEDQVLRALRRLTEEAASYGSATASMGVP